MENESERETNGEFALQESPRVVAATTLPLVQPVLGGGGARPDWPVTRQSASGHRIFRANSPESLACSPQS